MILAISIAMSLCVVPVSAKTDTNRYTYEGWVWVQDYYGWGPADYYGEDVRVVYVADNSWIVQIKENKDGSKDLYQVLQQKGIAEIYSIATGELLDTREFVAHERDVDKGMDAGTWDGTWYVAWGEDFSKLELLDYEWKIPGVYHFRALARNGVYEIYEYKVPGVSYYSWV